MTSQTALTGTHIAARNGPGAAVSIVNIASFAAHRGFPLSAP